MNNTEDRLNNRHFK